MLHINCIYQYSNIMHEYQSDLNVSSTDNNIIITLCRWLPLPNPSIENQIKHVCVISLLHHVNWIMLIIQPLYRINTCLDKSTIAYNFGLLKFIYNV